MSGRPDTYASTTESKTNRIDRSRPALTARELPRVDDRDGAALAARPELDPPVLLGEDRVVAAEPRARAGTEPRPALADDDHPGFDLLAGEDLHAEHLRVRVAPVARGSESFLVCHLLRLLRRRLCRRSRSRLGRSLGLLAGVRLLGRRRATRLLADRLDLHLRELRPKAVVAPIAGALLVLADPDLVAEDVADDPGRHLNVLWGKLRLPVAAEEQDLGMEALLLVEGEPVHEKLLALLDAVLLAAELHDRVRHRKRRDARRPRILAKWPSSRPQAARREPPASSRPACADGAHPGSPAESSCEVRPAGRRSARRSRRHSCRDARRGRGSSAARPRPLQTRPRRS